MKKQNSNVDSLWIERCSDALNLKKEVAIHIRLKLMLSTKDKIF